MNEWQSSRLSDLVSFRKGRKVEVSRYRKDGFAPYLGAGVLSGGEVTEYADKNLAVLAYPDDVLMLWDGERSGLVGRGKPGVVSSTVAKLTPKAGIDTTFLYYTLDAKFDWIQGRRTGTGVPHVPKDLGRILRVHYPTKQTEQRRIAEILSTVDEAIEQTEALIAKSQAIKTGLMHDLFTRGVLPNGHLRPPREEAPQLYKQSPLGWIPKEWEVAKLVSFAVPRASGFVNGPFGSNLLTSELRDSGVPVIYVQDIRLEGYQRVSNAHVTREKANDLSVCNVRAGDVLVSKVGDPPGIAALYSHERRAVVTQDVIRIRPTDDVSGGFLAGLLNSSIGQRAIRKITIEGTRARVSLTDFKRLNFPKPTHEEQYRVAEIIRSSLLALAGYRVGMEKLKALKCGLMHDLLTGKVTVTPLLRNKRRRS